MTEAEIIEQAVKTAFELGKEAGRREATDSARKSTKATKTSTPESKPNKETQKRRDGYLSLTEVSLINVLRTQKKGSVIIQYDECPDGTITWHYTSMGSMPEGSEKDTLLLWLSWGYTNKEIASIMGVSERTICRKLHDYGIR